MVPIISIVGERLSGKTRLIEGIVPELKSRGYRVGTIKHTPHEFEIDRQGKDSYRHFQAQADAVMVSSLHKLALVERTKEEQPLEDLVSSYLQDVDIVLAEGYGSEKGPKIEVIREELGTGPSYAKEDGLVAIVSDREFNVDLPRFRLGDYRAIADFLEERFIGKVSKREVTLRVNDRCLPLNPFVTKLFKETIGAMVKTLRGGEEARKIEIKIDAGDR